MGQSSDYPDVPDWTYKPEGYQAGAMVKYKGNVFRAAFWASEPGKDDPAHNGWRLYDELYDLTAHTPTAQPQVAAYIPTWLSDLDTSSVATYQNITHALVAFLMFSEATPGALDPQAAQATGSLLATVVPAGQAVGTKIGVALGGAADYGFLALMERAGADPDDPAVMQAVANVVQFVSMYGLDHVSLDLECWGGTGTAIRAGSGRTPEQRRAAPGRAGPDGVRQAAQAGASRHNPVGNPARHLVVWQQLRRQDRRAGRLAGHHDLRFHRLVEHVHRWARHTALTTIRQQEAYAAGSRAPGPVAARRTIRSCRWKTRFGTGPTRSTRTGGALARGAPEQGHGRGTLYGYDFAYTKGPDPESGQIPPGYKVLRYKDILSQLAGAAAGTGREHEVAGSTPRPSFTGAAGDYPYAHNVYFETPATAAGKMEFAEVAGTLGVIIWEASGDVREDNKSIIQALYSASGNVPSLPVVPTATPGQHRHMGRRRVPGTGESSGPSVQR